MPYFLFYAFIFLSVIRLLVNRKTELSSCLSPSYLSLPRLQELLKSEHHEEGRVPRTVECELTEDLVDACIPGDVVTVTGIIRVINNYMDIGGGMTLHSFLINPSGS